MTNPVDKGALDAHFYCGIMMEAVDAVWMARRIEDEASQLDPDDSGIFDLKSNSGVYSRYAFHTACIACEAGANALLENLRGASASLIKELDRLPVIAKYEIFALVNGTPLDRSIDHFAKIQQVIRYRNSFVHPKEQRVKLVDADGGGYRLEERTFGDRTYPMALDHMEYRHVVDMVRDILRFIAWVVFDTCGLSVEEGASLLSRQIRSYNGTVFFANEQLGYDIRSFGIADK